MALSVLSSVQLRDYIQNHHENSYLLVDVRQPGEYRTAHIPGARLLPLAELMQTLDALPEDKELVFYCHSGGRSMAAAVMVEEERPGQPAIYNLHGGMLGWDGASLADEPEVAIFAGKTTAEQFLTAMNLEKGALRFYSRMQQAHGDRPWAGSLDRLSQAETAHAKTVYRFLKQADNGVEAFETLFERLEGDVLEGGLGLDRALERLAALTDESCLRVVELALKIEVAAYDLYRNLADQSDDRQAHEAFISLAQAEKGHMRVLIQMLERCPG